MDLKTAMNLNVANFDNVNVSVWAIPRCFEGTQARFDINCTATVSLCPPNNKYKEVWSLYMVETLRKKGKSEQEILENVHSFYRVPEGMINPFY